MNVSFYGRLARDPQTKSISDGKDFTAFTVATSLKVKDGDNFKALFVNVSAFGGAGKTIKEYFRKGSRIVVDGIVRNVDIGHGKDKDYINFYVDLTDFSFVDSRDEAKRNQRADSGNKANDELADDDLPW